MNINRGLKIIHKKLTNILNDEKYQEETKNIEEKESESFNTCLLIPLFKPAVSSYTVSTDHQLRGGGLFIYGHYDYAKKNVYKNVLSLLHFFNKIILNESRNQIAFDYLKHQGSNELIHTFKSFLSGNLLSTLKDVKNDETYQQLHQVSKDQIEGIVSNTQNYIEYLNAVLNGFKDLIEGEITYLKVAKIGKIVESLNTSDFTVKFDIEDKDKDKEIKINEGILMLVLKELYDNSINAYKTQKIPIGECIFKCSVESDNVLLMEYTNAGISIPKSIADNFGLYPKFDKKHQTTSLGGFFMNNLLMWSNAENIATKEQEREKYIKAEKENGSVKFSFKFKIMNNG